MYANIYIHIQITAYFRRVKQKVNGNINFNFDVLSANVISNFVKLWSFLKNENKN